MYMKGYKIKASSACTNIVSPLPPIRCPQCPGHVGTAPWWRWLRRNVTCARRSNPDRDLQTKPCANRTACPSCPAGRRPTGEKNTGPLRTPPKPLSSGTLLYKGWPANYSHGDAQTEGACPNIDWQLAGSRTMWHIHRRILKSPWFPIAVYIWYFYIEDNCLNIKYN